MIKQALFLILCSVFIGLISGQCQENGVQCLSANTFVFCENNVAGEAKFKCPDGNVCTTHKDICRPNCGEDPSGPLVPTKCGVCEASVNKLFTCISESAFIFCYGKDVPFVGSEGQCKKGYVCDVNNPKVCSPEGTVEPSCVTDLSGLPTLPSDGGNMCPETTITTQDPITITVPTTVKKEDPLNLEEICANIPELEKVDLFGCREYVSCKAEGGPVKGSCFPQFFNIETQNCEDNPPKSCERIYDHLCENVDNFSFFVIKDTNCKEYVSCVRSGDIYVAKQWQCDSDTYFDEQNKRCVDDKPTNC